MRLLGCFLLMAAVAVEADFDDCNHFYDSAKNYTLEGLQDLLSTTHRRIMPYTDDDELDVWDALIDLDPGDSPSTVRLVYRQVDVDAVPYGTSDTWNREHLWPQSLGVGSSGPAFTDLHHLRPADWNVNAARGNEYFGVCMDDSTCRRPAHAEASLTESDAEVFAPPPSVRGDIARAIFYMAVRYADRLVLTDCPSEDEPSMAFRSQLLQWHVDDPVDDGERQRNQRACEWQGNRNPFVDHPEWTTTFFGRPQEQLADGTYACSPTDDPPTAEPPSVSPPTTTDPCAALQPGDVMVIALQADNPDMIALVTLQTLPAGLTLFLTDNAWTGTELYDNEGTVRYTLPTSLPAGTVFGYGLDNVEWESVQGSLALSASGDNVLLYCESDERMHPLAALSTADAWSYPGQADYDTDQSALPETLAGMAAALPHFDNYIYVGPLSGTTAELQGYLSSADNWSGSNSGLATFVPTELTVVAEPELPAVDSSARTWTEAWTMLALFLVAASLI